MSEYERFALVLDSEHAELGRTTMRLLELGIDVLYANDLDEAALLANQETGRLGAVLAPAGLGPGRVRELLTRVCSRLDAGARALVLVGLEPDAEAVAELLAAGVCWHLWEPYEERELRFVMSAAMSIGHTGERRKEVRIPVEIETAVFMGRHRKDVTVHDLSPSGAYLAAPEPFLEGSRLSIDIELATGRVVGKAEVVNARTADRPGRADVPLGMGVQFGLLSGDSSDVLRAYIDGWLARFRLSATDPD